MMMIMNEVASSLRIVIEIKNTIDEKCI